MSLPKLSVFTAVMLALSLLFAAAAQGADEHRITLPHSAEITEPLSGCCVEIRAIYSCAPRPGTTYLNGEIGQVHQYGHAWADFDGDHVVTCDGKPHTTTVWTADDMCDYPPEPCFVSGPATISATFYQTETWIFGPRVTQTVMLRSPGDAAAQ